MRIFLVGYMGSGKSTIGRKLSKQLQLPLIDLDHYIEEKQGMSVPEIFAQFGEAKFREFEAKYLQEAIDNNRRLVLSAGGGTPCKGDNMDRMNKAGITIYLKQSPAQLSQRLIKSKNPRPLIAGMSQEEICEFATQQLEIREPYYNKAQIVIDGSSRDVARVLEALENHPSFNREEL